MNASILQAHAEVVWTAEHDDTSATSWSGQTVPNILIELCTRTSARGDEEKASAMVDACDDSCTLICPQV